MARTKAQIETEIAALEKSGKGDGPDAKKLWSELEDVDASPPPKPIDVPGIADGGEEEWMFVQKCLAEMNIDFTRGSTTGAVKRIYNDIGARLVAWRLMREIMQMVGPGGKWPQWSALDRNEATGEKNPPKPVAPAPAAVPFAPPAVAGVTEGGMPILSNGGMSEVEQRAAALRNSLSMMVGSRAAPERTAAPV